MQDFLKHKKANNFRLEAHKLRCLLSHGRRLAMRNDGAKATVLKGLKLCFRRPSPQTSPFALKTFAHPTFFL
jgi:hypothetical protein